MPNYPRLDDNGLLYYTQEIKKKIDASVPGDMTGASASANGAHGLVPQPNAGQESQFLRGDGVWANPPVTPNTIESISVNNNPITPDVNKNVNISVPTTTSELTNNSDFQTGTEVQQAIAAALADITGIDFVIVQTLPQTGEKGIFYLVPIQGETNNIYDEYVWVRVGGTSESPVYGFEKIGTTQVDLSGYVQSSEMTTISNSDIDDIIDEAFNPSSNG